MTPYLAPQLNHFSSLPVVVLSLLYILYVYNPRLGCSTHVFRQSTIGIIVTTARRRRSTCIIRGKRSGGQRSFLEFPRTTMYPL